MKLNAQMFLDALAGASRVASNDKMLPALRSVSIRVKDGDVWIESTNRFHAIRTNLIASEIGDDTQVTIDLDDVAAWVTAIKKLPKYLLGSGGGVVTLTLGDRTARLEVNERAYEVPTLMCDYPRIGSLFTPKPYEGNTDLIQLGLSPEYLSVLAKINKNAWRFTIESNRVLATSTGDGCAWEYALMSVRLSKPEA